MSIILQPLIALTRNLGRDKPCPYSFGVALFSLLLIAHTLSAQLPTASPSAVGVSSERLARIDRVVQSSIDKKELPGAVVLVGRHGRVVWRKSYGARAVEPQREPMTVDTIFDLASLTKIVATATSMMILIERGEVSLADPVALYIPEFGKNGKERITVEQLMTHRAGLPPDNEIADYVGKSIDPL